jgi:hypothetical protein
MLRNGNCINTDFTEDTIKNDENDTFSALLDHLAGVFGFCRINTTYIHCQKTSNWLAHVAKQDRKAH